MKKLLTLNRGLPLSVATHIPFMIKQIQKNNIKEKINMAIKSLRRLLNLNGVMRNDEGHIGQRIKVEIPYEYSLDHLNNLFKD